MAFSFGSSGHCDLDLLQEVVECAAQVVPRFSFRSQSEEQTGEA